MVFSCYPHRAWIPPYRKWRELRSKRPHGLLRSLEKYQLDRAEKNKRRYRELVIVRRAFWTVGMAALGLMLGLKGQDTPSDIRGTVLTVLWFASIGFSIGSIFSQTKPTTWVVVYWASALALVFPFLALALAATIMTSWPDLPYSEQIAVGILGGFIGAILGVFAGKLNLRRLRGRSQRAEGAAVPR